MLRVLICALLLVFSTSSVSNAAQLSALKRVDNFIFLIDDSGSMMMKNNFNVIKMTEAKQAVINTIDVIPDEINVIGHTFTICNIGSISLKDTNKQSIIEQLKLIKTDKEIFGRMSPLSNDIAKLSSILNINDSRKTAVFLVTDGEYTNGVNPANVIKKIYDEHANIVFHVISLASTKKGVDTINEIIELHPKSLSIDVNALLNRETAFDFARYTVFGFHPIVKIYFDFDKYNIVKSDIDKLKANFDFVNSEFLMTQVYIQGWTDYIGTDEYNYKLSRNRAGAVNKVFSTLSTMDILEYVIEGAGKSYMYDNKTRDGRALNRRADVYFF